MDVVEELLLEIEIKLSTGITGVRGKKRVKMEGLRMGTFLKGSFR